MSTALLILNAGSSSLKFAVYRPDAAGTPHAQVRGQVDAIGAGARLRVVDKRGRTDIAITACDHAQALACALDWLDAQQSGLDVHAAGHRIVHGGTNYRHPVRIDAAVLANLESLVPLSPLHQPQGLAGIHALARLRPGLPQVACFDTAFHHTLPPHAWRLALPREFEAHGIRRYGFHGLSYEYIAGVLPEYLGDAADGRVVVAHLGNGASLCALRARQSVETSMSFTPLDGLPMATRCGALDPGVLLHLLRAEGLTPAALDDLLHHRAGLFGVSGVSGDVRTLLASDNPQAAEALELFTYRTAQAVAAHAVALGGLDALVFTAGIGEHAAPVRAAICRQLSWLGLALDDAANARHGPRISAPASRVSAWVIPTDEESVIAGHTWALTRQA
ncbi:MAG: acetate/propionate family kinase [Pseudomonadota bacterium]